MSAADTSAGESPLVQGKVSLWDRCYHPARSRNELPGLPAISKATARVLQSFSIGPEALVTSLRRSDYSPAFQVDLDGLAGKRGTGALMLFNPLRRDVALLQMWRNSVWYAESASGVAILSLLGHSLPESICAVVGREKLRLADIVETNDEVFYSSGNPVVTSICNEQCGGQPAITFRLRVRFTQSNWHSNR